MKLTIDAEDLTLGEVEFFEAEAGLSFEDLANGKSSTRAMLALIVIQERRTDPAYSMDDARKLKLREVEVVGVEADPPTKPRKVRAAS